MNKILVVLLVFILASCTTIVRNSKPGVLDSILSKSSEKSDSLLNAYLRPCDQIMVAKFGDFKSVDSSNMKKFNDGIYLMRLFNSDSTYYVKKQNEVKKGRKINLVDYRLNNNLSPWSADKIQYFSFIDNERVFFYSPKQKVKIKTGETSIENLAFTDNRNFVRKTSNYLKLGSDKEFKTVKRGYYKEKKDSVFVILEHSTLKGKIHLLGFKFYLGNLNLETQNIFFENLNHDSAFFDRLKFKFYEVPSNLMLINKNQPLIVKGIKEDSGNLVYNCINIFSSDSLNRFNINENKKRKFTF
jgi:hypothetical protein